MAKFHFYPYEIQSRIVERTKSLCGQSYIDGPEEDDEATETNRCNTCIRIMDDDYRPSLA